MKWINNEKIKLQNKSGLSLPAELQLKIRNLQDECALKK